MLDLAKTAIFAVSAGKTKMPGFSRHFAASQAAYFTT